MPAIVNPRLTSIEPRRTLIRATLAALSPTKVVCGVVVIALIGDDLASRTVDAMRCNPRAAVADARDDKNVRIRARCPHDAQPAPCGTAECCAKGAIARRKAQTRPLVADGKGGPQKQGAPPGSVFARERSDLPKNPPRGLLLSNAERRGWFAGDRARARRHSTPRPSPCGWNESGEVRFAIRKARAPS